MGAVPKALFRRQGDFDVEFYRVLEHFPPPGSVEPMIYFLDSAFGIGRLGSVSDLEFHSLVKPIYRLEL